MLALVNGEDLYRIVTDQGELVIETNGDENIRVEVLADGAVVKVIDDLTDRSIDIRSGKYTLRAVAAEAAGSHQSADEPPAVSFVISPNQVQLHRGGQQIVSIRREPTDADPSGRNPGLGDNISSPNTLPNVNMTPRNIDSVAGTNITALYDGRTAGQWLTQIQRERKPESIKMAIDALAAFVDDDSEFVDTALAAVRPLIREHGSIYSENETDWTRTFNRFMIKLSPEQRIDFVLTELKSGTTASRNYCCGLILANVGVGLESGLPATQEPSTRWRKCVRQNLSRLLEVVFEMHNAMDEYTAADRLAARSCLSHALGECFVKGYLNQLQPDAIPRIGTAGSPADAGRIGAITVQGTQIVVGCEVDRVSNL